MEFRLLGPVELEGERGGVSLGSAKQRALLSVLLLYRNEVVSQERLVDELWGDAPPASAAHSIEAYVSRLRKTLHDAGAQGILSTRGKGYVLDVDGERYDVVRFEELLDEARRVDPEQASALLREALALWRGPALADVELLGPASVEVERLEELRLTAVEERIEADLAVGDPAALVGELHSLVAEHPLRERLRSQQMRALYGAGRQADALDCYADARRALGELGLEPSQELNDLQRRILTHDPSLAPRVRERPPTRRRRRMWLAGAGLLVAAAAVAFMAVAFTRSSETTSSGITAVDHSVGLVDPATNRLVADIPIGGRPGDGIPNIAVGLGSVWVCDIDDGTLLRIDPRTRTVARTIGLGATPSAIAVGHGAVWVLTTPATQVIKLDSLGSIVRRIPLRQNVAGPSRGSIASGADAIWVLHTLNAVAKLDPETGRVLHDTIGLGGVAAQAVTVTRDAVWLTSGSGGVLVRLDPETGAVEGATPPAGAPVAFWADLTSGEGGVWVSDFDDLVWRIDPLSRRPSGTVAVDHGPRGIAVHDGSIWVDSSLGGAVDRIDPKTMRVIHRIHVGANPSGVAAGLGGVWVSFG